jgi:hypothetical protein
VTLRYAPELFDGGGNGPAARVAQNDYQASSEPPGRKFNASYTRRRHDISGDANHEQIAEALIEDDLGRNASVGATEHDSEGFLTVDLFRASDP